MKKLLIERLSDILYHFTSVESLYKIVYNNEIVLSSSYEKNAETDYNQGFYLSCTRTKFSKFGYSNKRNVRITLDGRKLNQHFGGNAINYWGDSMGKNWLMQNISDNPTKEYKLRQQDYNMSNVENEDRVFSNTPVIDSPFDYITRIDILRDDEYEHIDARIRYVLSNCKNITFVYDNELDFNKQSNNIINEQILSGDVTNYLNHLKTFQKKENAVDELSTLLYAILVVDVESSDWSKNVSQILKKVGLQEYIKPIINGNKLYHKTYYEVIKCGYWVNAFRELHASYPNAYKRFAPYFVSFLKKNNFNNARELMNYKEKLAEFKNGRDNIDYDKKLDLYTIITEYGDICIIPDLNTELVKNYKRYIDLRNVIYEIENDTYDGVIKYNTDKSSSYNSFIAYIKHIFYGKKGTFENVLNILYKLYNYDIDKVFDILKVQIEQRPTNANTAMFDNRNPYPYDSKQYYEYENKIKQLFSKDTFRKIIRETINNFINKNCVN